MEENSSKEVYHESLSRYPLLARVSQTSFKKNTLKTYQSILSKLTTQFGERDLNSPTPEEILSFLTQINQGTKQTTKRTRYSQLTSFFNFITQNLDHDLRSPCDTPMLKKFYRSPGLIRWNILEKEVVDEVIFRTIKPRNQLILELMARGGMRISEVLQLTSIDIEDRKLTLTSPKSGKEREVVFIPQKIADRLREYITSKGIGSDKRIFPISYTAGRRVVNKAGRVVGIHLRPHDLRRHAATYASRSGVPIEIVSKVILRHANLSTTQRYLGTVSDVEAMRWIDNLYG
jgi:integrase/recombinase XerD